MRIHPRIALLLLLAITMLPLTGCRRAPAPEDEDASTEPKPPEGPLSVQVEPQSLKLPQGGMGKLKVTVARGNYKGPLTLELRNAPDDLAAARVTLPAGVKAGEIEVTASDLARGSERADTNVLAVTTVGPRKEVASGGIRVTVQGPPFALETSPSLLKVPQGSKVKLKVTAARKGYDGPIAVELVNLPPNLEGGRATIPQGKDRVEVELASPSNTPPGERADVQVRGLASVSGTTFRALSAAFKVSIPPPPFSLHIAPAAVKLTQGGKVLLTVSANRKEYRGPINLEFRNLPAGVTVSKASIPAWRGSEEIELTAGVQAAPGVKGDVQVVGRAAVDMDYQAVSPPLTLTLQPALLLQVRPRPVQLAQGGKVLVTITPVRHNYDGPLTVEFRGLPPGVTAPAVTLAASARSEAAALTAAADAPLTEKSEVQVVARTFGMGERELAVVHLPLAVLEAGSIPTGPFGLKVQPKVLKLTPGNKATLTVLALRKEYQGPIALELRGLPPLVTAGKVTIGEKQQTAQIEVSAAADATLGDRAEVNVLGVASPDLQIASPGFTVSVQPRPFELRALSGSLRVPLGGSATLKIQATRKNYDGPIVLELQNLPAGVSAARTTVPAGQNEVEVEVAATDRAEPATRPDLHVQGTGADRQQVASPNFSLAVVPGLMELRVEPAVIKLSNGVSVKVKVTASRKGHAGPIPVELRQLPKYVTAAKATIDKGADATEVEIKAGFEVTEGDTVEVHARAVVGVPAKVVLSPCVTLSVVSIGQPPPFALKVEPQALKVAPGEAAKIKVTAARQAGYTGPISLEVHNLPADVTAAKVTLAPGQPTGEILLVTTVGTHPASRSDVCVVGTAVMGNGQSQTHASPHLSLLVSRK